MNKKQQLKELIKYYSGGNKAEFARLLGISPQGVSTWLSRGSFDIELIYTKCEHVSSEWLFTGKGSMTRKEQPVIYQENDTVYKELYEKIYEENKMLLQNAGKTSSEIEMLKKTNEALKNEIHALKEELNQGQTESFIPSVAGSERKMLPTRANIADAPFSRKKRNPQIEK